MASDGIDWASRPWRLLPNRVSRFYRGGALLDRFRGAPEPRDTDRPEDWVGSATRTWTRPGAAPTEEGLSDAEVAGSRRPVADLLAADPAAVAGPALATTGATGLLVKLLDASIRLPVHAHPSRAFARAHLGSPFGKAEAWIVLATRQLPGEPEPHVRLGFRRDVSRAELRTWIEEERTEQLLDSVHRRPTRAGDVWFVPPGTPHAIGAGVFILEVQEPTDFSIVLETRGFPIRAEDAHLGLGWALILEAIDRAGRSDDDIEALTGSWSAAAGPILPRGAEPFFWSRVLRVTGEPTKPDLPATFVIGVAIAGRGLVRTGGGALPVAGGDAFAVPAMAVADLTVEPVPGPVELILCGGNGIDRA